MASQLHQKHDLTLFESSDSSGGHACTINVEIGGSSFDIDTGFVVFNNARYPEFLRIIRRLGVETQASDMSFSVSCNRTGIEYVGTSINGLFAQRRNSMRPTFLRLLADYLRFSRRARDVLKFDERQGSRTTHDVMVVGGSGQTISAMARDTAQFRKAGRSACPGRR